MSQPLPIERPQADALTFGRVEVPIEMPFDKISATVPKIVAWLQANMAEADLGALPATPQEERYAEETGFVRALLIFEKRVDAAKFFEHFGRPGSEVVRFD